MGVDGGTFVYCVMRSGRRFCSCVNGLLWTGAPISWFVRDGVKVMTWLNGL